MNYRHAFHAGNHGDVLKHVVLLGLVDALQRKPAPLWALDTHAGRGLYALDGDQALRTREADGGIRALEAAVRPGDSLPAPLRRYLDALQACRDAHGTGAYPGSPWLLAHALRTDDRLACCELQADEATALKALFAGDTRTSVHRRDGYEALRALLPPTPRRGLVLIDPPYEAQLAEFDTILAALADALARWPQGVFAVWYPIKQARTVVPFLREATALPSRAAWTAELLVRHDDSPLRMNGSGVLVLNPPFQLDNALAPALARLGEVLARDGGRAGLRWLRRGA
jgi:23S rRNA (adenine2030-N6)-methyltransferase